MRPRPDLLLVLGLGPEGLGSVYSNGGKVESIPLNFDEARARDRPGTTDAAHDQLV